MHLAAELTKLIPPERVLTRPIERLAYANDASYFYLVPQAVVQPNSIAEVRDLFRFSQFHRIPLTFRAAGTSLCGQAVTDGLLVDLSKHWGAYQVEEQGALIRAQPGIVGTYLNNVLKPYRRKIGPDPASIDACMLGGILSNNSSGMCCGTEENSYRTLHSLTFLLPNGFSLNSGIEGAHTIFENEQPHLAQGLLDLRRRLLADAQLAERVRRKYQMKNTNGYALNAFLDYEKPLDILTHLLIGSEGTLAFIAEAVLRTVPDYPYKYTAQLYFASIQAAAEAVFPLRKAGARAVEIMDRAALRSVENLPGVPEVIRSLPESAAAILVEFQAADASAMQTLQQTAAHTLAEMKLLHPAEFTTDPAQQAILWKARKGMFATVGALRPPGTTLLLEDVVFPVERLGEAVVDLQALFRAYGYDDSIIFGHAKDGNLHYTISQRFDTLQEIERFDRFNREIAKLVCEKYDGALKGEHGTGRSMAPFLVDEWGENGRALMRDIKALFDPDHLLNPNIIINDNPQAHVTDVKVSPLTDERIDPCIECGYCESRCPSRELTLTPRQRIVIQRTLQRLRQMASSGNGKPVIPGLDLDARALIAVLQEEYAYAGNDTCAVDGLCALACPVGINTGELTKTLRSQQVSPTAQRIALWVVRWFGLVEALLRLGVRLGHFADRLTNKDWRRWLLLMERLSRRRLPKWNDAIPQVPKTLPVAKGSGQNGKSRATAEPLRFVYFPSCINRNLGQPDDPSLLSIAEVMVTVARRAGIDLFIPADVRGACCGMPFSSKGYRQAYQEMLQHTLEKLWRWSEGGRYPIVIDATSCAYTLRNAGADLDGVTLQRYRQLTLLDSVEFLHDTVLPRLDFKPLAERVVLHPNCSAQKLGLQDKLVAIAKRCVESVTVPLDLGCCGFAGDRGFLLPELTASATRREASEVTRQTFDGYYSSNLTCEIGMRAATHQNYLGIVYLVEKASRG
ncbi:MAG: FAD-binding oxidoreductase [Anaerolineae bacterium]|jgi:D-lactate dehydrogenase|nr:MAG: FAD-binding oxidoreductase [Anaerolineae bacterium]